MKTVKVVAALIENDGKYLVGCRSTGKFTGFWEFPGGKVEDNEENISALKREILEELGVEIKVQKLELSIEHQYSDFYLVMNCFRCELESTLFELNDHSEIKWIDPKGETKLNWLPADTQIVEYLKVL